MDLNLQLGTRLKQEQTLSAQMLQSVNILQMNSLELETAIKQEIEVNPLLETVEPGESAEETFDGDGAEQPGALESDDSDGVEAGMLETQASIDWDSLFKEGFAGSERPLKDLNAPDPEDEEWRNQTKSVASLQEKLMEQLRGWKRPPRIVAIVEYLIDSLDDRGYLTSQSVEGAAPAVSENPDIREAEAVISGELELEKASLAVQEAFHVLHSFSPRGIGARNLRECLLIQAYAVPDFSELAIKILEGHFEELKALRYPQIAKELGVSTDEVQAAVRSLSSLSPHPGLLINDVPVPYIAPDLEVVEDVPGHFRAVLKRESRFRGRLRINQTYRRLLMSDKTSKADKDFIRERLNKANSFIHCVSHRESTMEAVMQKIIEFQPEFFSKGPEFLRPMILQEIADALDLNLSTISRVVNGKYVETKYGVYELKQFFSAAVRQENGEDISSKRIIDALKKLIEGEDKTKPYSDQALSEMLSKMGMKVARRTVAKYREENLKILSARYRKGC